MSKQSLIILSIIIALVFLCLGGAAGILYQTQKEVSQSGNPAEIIKEITSKAITSVSAYGQVTNIQGRNIILSYAGDSITIKIGDDAKIYSFTQSSASTQQIAKFENIKNGDNLTVSSKLLSDGTLEGQTVLILSAVP